MLEVENLSDQEKAVYYALKDVIDPELQVDIVDLGLIYGIEVIDKTCKITMTLTIMGCPLSEWLNNTITKAAKSVANINDCQIKVVWYPQWNPSMMSRIARMTLGIHG
ncbi:metal-sulfur cluster assembly factor [Lactobacillus johnsonii]|uniref:metal-sulfur cluster assembly factor n=1 Tax=Lactobacillus johnsonii TaxID=33959 RepID=UPI0028EAED5D|nr:metal-sulfur cluster assembly factor [Lactobacillus johnsonii]MDT9605559.1 metal-sulfur cluster assembly factor [Lactobacillus johnsonii]